LGRLCLVALTWVGGYGSFDRQNFGYIKIMLLVNTKTLYLIKTWRTTQENSTAAVSNGSDFS
jgi:hypothetical protein